METKATQKFSEQGPEALWIKANILIEKDEPVLAVGILNKIIEQHPKYGRAYNHLGYLWETKFRDLAQAEEHYRNCLAFCPEYPAIYYN